jgi:Spy/CpxP family protein refolding chaperone
MITKDRAENLGVEDTGMRSHRLRMLVLVSVVSLAGAVAFSQTVTRVAGHEGGIGFAGRMLGFRTDYLNLTDAQRAQIRDILAKEKPTVQPLLQQLAQGHQQMLEIEQAGTFDEATARTLAMQQSQTMAELMVQKARIKSELMQVLTPEQKAKMIQFQARQQARFQKHLQQMQASPSETVPN